MVEHLQEENNTYDAFIGPITLKFDETKRALEGKFTIENYSEAAIAEATYSVYITSNKQGQFPEFYFDKQTFSAINIPAKNTFDVQFSYKVHPSFSSQDAGVQVELSSKWGWFINRGFSENSTRINSLTKTHLLIPIKSVLKTELWNEYYIGSGPAIYEELIPKNLFLHFFIQNLSDQKISFSPKIDIYTYIDEWSPIKTLEIPDIYSVEPKAISKEIIIPIPNMNFHPDVYIWKLSLINNDNNIFHPDFVFRWMVGWEMAKIQDIVSQDIYFKKWYPIKMILKYTGTPVDIYFDPKKQDPLIYQSSNISNKEALFRATLIDRTWKDVSQMIEKRIPIYRASNNDIWLDNVKEISFEIIPLVRSSELSIKASLFSASDNRLLDEKIVPIITPLGLQSKHRYEWYAWLIAILVGGAIFFSVWKWKIHK